MRSTFDFSGYRVLVAGGSKGIGRSIALAFAQTGAAVSVCARGEQALAAIDGELSAHGGTVHTESCDLRDPQAVQDWVEHAAGALGGIDVLMNNASGYGFDDTDDASWEADFRIDLMAAVRASRHALPHLRQSEHASILHTSSIAALNPRPSGACYAALKAAVSHYTTSQAKALASERIRVNAIAPGSIEFPGGLWDDVRRNDPDRYAATLARIPFGAYGRPEDIAHAALFLASPFASWITGQVLAVDGGQSLNG
ncbi:SDR family NAD(P)-dependent oxidoreductase [Oleiagrimonas soli]|uniref:3-oxoacyl-ACP reductase n=1 Tax=Oleiagrimonas soli TaxID=1543381 RepID=A0A099CVF2_9GAMM|nr:SDR family NAD(P)-dependent oxidoreductase [Oleiagrimonas soli]KGI77577.1 3-oxoacyl-ACP reductase [Oleiagrimonas soli]MBB6182937.1 3-oxoacyl-[acyl-carrier protein] reductase [Oleiagrimonas soli]